jgi:hypothetical protein
VFDLHVHAGPDIVPRLADDRRLLLGYARAGWRGCVLKAHYDNTAGRAAAASHGLDLRVYGGLVLNQQAGGVNPSAVAAALAMGARVIWMPTADAHTQRAAGLPRLCCGRPGLPSTAYAVPPVDPSAAGRARRVLSLIAEADAVLATGHLSAPEVDWLLTEARAAGVTRVLLTHPGWTVPGMTAAEAAEFTARGAYAEITALQLLRQPDCDAARLAAFVRAAGYDRVVLSSDAGQPENPPPVEALGILLDALAGEGLDRRALTACASEIPEGLVTP